MNQSIHTIRDRVTQKRGEARLVDFAHPGILILQGMLDAAGAGKRAEAQHAISVVYRGLPGDRGACGRTSDVKLPRPQMIRQLDDIPRQALHAQGGGIRQRGFAVAAHINACHTKVTCQMRSPGVETHRAAHRCMHEDAVCAGCHGSV